MRPPLKLKETALKIDKKEPAASEVVEDKSAKEEISSGTESVGASFKPRDSMLLIFPSL